VRRKTSTLVALAMAAALAGCGTGIGQVPGTPIAPAPEAVSSPAPAPAVEPTPAESATTSTTMVMIIRHGEKPEDDDTTGVDANGNENESSMTKVGWERAHALVDLFAPPQGACRPGLARPATIYAARATDEGEGLRTRETVAPLATALGVAVNTSYGKGEEDALVEHVLAQPGPTLISWQHSQIPGIAEAFPSVNPTPPPEWPDDRYDVVWVLTKTVEGWHFTQTPELVLPQDQPTVIEEEEDD
jgi:hypothetical protein